MFLKESFNDENMDDILPITVSSILFLLISVVKFDKFVIISFNLLVPHSINFLTDINWVIFNPVFITDPIISLIAVNPASKSLIIFSLIFLLSILLNRVETPSKIRNNEAIPCLYITFKIIILVNGPKRLVSNTAVSPINDKFFLRFINRSYMVLSEKDIIFSSFIISLYKLVITSFKPNTLFAINFNFIPILTGNVFWRILTIIGNC